MSSTWDYMSDNDRAAMRDAGRDEGGHHLGARVRPQMPSQPLSDRLRPSDHNPCPQCGMPDLREVGPDNRPWFLACAECGWRSELVTDAFTGPRDVLRRYEET